MQYNFVHPQPSLEFSKAGADDRLSRGQQQTFKVYDENERPYSANSHPKTQLDTRDNNSPSSQNNLKIMTQLIEAESGVGIQYPKDFNQQQKDDKMVNETQFNQNYQYVPTGIRNLSLNNVRGMATEHNYILDSSTSIPASNTKDGTNELSPLCSPYCGSDKNDLNISGTIYFLYQFKLFLQNASFFQSETSTLLIQRLKISIMIELQDGH